MKPFDWPSGVMSLVIEDHARRMTGIDGALGDGGALLWEWGALPP